MNTSNRNHQSGFISKGWIIALSIIGILAITALGFAGWVIKHYNGIKRESNQVANAWSQVENVYQRRFDMIPNLVETVKGVAAFEKDTFTGVAQARASVGQMKVDLSSLPAGQSPNPEQFEKFAAAQQGLGTALSRLMMVQEKYPELKANANFTALQVEIAGTENRISVERKSFNDVTTLYNNHIDTFPGNLFASFFGFKPKPLFKMDEAAKSAPKVDFSSKK